jgi:hypothetical protein
MMNILKYIFCPRWITVEVFYGDVYDYRTESSSGEFQNIFEIEYSEIRKRYRINWSWNCSGISRDKAYHQALNRLIELNKTLINK